MQTRQPRFMILALVLLVAAVCGAAWWWLSGESVPDHSRNDRGPVAVKANGRSDSIPPPKDHSNRDGRTNAGERQPTTAHPNDPAATESKPTAAPESVEIHPEIAQLERIHFQIPVAQIVNGREITLWTRNNDELLSLGKQGILDGGSWRFVLRQAPTVDGSEAPKHVESIPAGYVYRTPLASSGGVRQFAPSGIVIGGRVELIAETCSPQDWSVLALWLTLAKRGQAEQSGLVWYFEKDGEVDEGAKPLVTSSLHIGQNHAYLSFAKQTLELDALVTPGEWLVTGRFVVGSSSTGVAFNRINLKGSPGSAAVGGALRGTVFHGGDGLFVGHLKGTKEPVNSPAGYGFEVWAYNHATEEEVKQRLRPHRYAASLPAPNVVGNVLDFGDVPWPGRTMSLDVDRTTEAFRHLDEEGHSDRYVIQRPRPVVFSISDKNLDLGELMQTSHNPLSIGLPLGPMPTGFNVDARVEGMYGSTFESAKLDWNGEIAGHRSVTLAPKWERTVAVRVRIQGQELTSAFAIAIPGNDKDFPPPSKPGEIPEVIGKLTIGYGTIQADSHTKLPYRIQIPRDSDAPQGFWVAAAHRDHGAAIVWMPISQTEDLVLELGRVGTGVRAVVTAAMTGLGNDSIPGATEAIAQGWRGEFEMRLSGKLEDDRDFRSLGKMTFSRSTGHGKADVMLDTSLAWTFRLEVMDHLKTYDVCYDTMHVFTSDEIRCANPTDPTPTFDIGFVPPPKFIGLWQSPDLPPPHERVSVTCEGTPITAKPAFAWANGHGVDAAKWIPAFVWDGKLGTPISWQIRRDQGGLAIPHGTVDVAARASVIVISNTSQRFDLGVEGPWWFWGWRWEYTMSMERGRKYRIFLPNGHCKLTVTAASENLGQGASSTASATKPTSKVLNINVGEEWAGDHEIVMD